MAPRGGGFKTGGGGGNDELGHGASTRWNHLVRLSTNSDTSMLVAEIVIGCLCLCFLGASLFVVWPFKVYVKGRWIFKWFGFPVAAGSAVLYFVIIITTLLVAQAEAHVYESYRLLFVFANWFFLQSSVLIFSIAYSIIHNRFAVIWRDAVPRLRVWQTAHYLLICLLTVFWIADFIIYLNFTLKYLSSDVSVPAASASAYRKFDTTLHIVYLIVTLDVLICAITIFGGDRFRKLNSRISTYLLFIITPSLLIANLFLAIFSIYFTLLNHSSSFANPFPDYFTDPLPNPFTNLLHLIVAGIPTVAALSGIILVGLQRDWHIERAHDGASAEGVQ